MTRLRKGISWTYCIGVQCVLAVVASPDPVFPGVPCVFALGFCKLRAAITKSYYRPAKDASAVPGGVVGMDDWWVLSLFGLLRGFSSGG